MRLFINDHFFISIIKEDNEYNCQVMNLIHGLGMIDASIHDAIQSDIISSIVTIPVFKRTALITTELQKVLDFQLELMLQLKE